MVEILAIERRILSVKNPFSQSSSHLVFHSSFWWEIRLVFLFAELMLESQHSIIQASVVWLLWLIEFFLLVRICWRRVLHIFVGSLCVVFWGSLRWVQSVFWVRVYLNSARMPLDKGFDLESRCFFQRLFPWWDLFSWLVQFLNRHLLQSWFVWVVVVNGSLLFLLLLLFQRELLLLLRLKTQKKVLCLLCLFSENFHF